MTRSPSHISGASATFCVVIRAPWGIPTRVSVGPNVRQRTAAVGRRPRPATLRAGPEPPTDEETDAPENARYGGAFRSPNDPVVSPSASKPRVKPWWLRVAQDPEYDDLRTFVFSFAIALMVRTVIIEPRYIPSQSMMPTFEVGDQLLVEKVSKYLRPYTRGDVVVFFPPPALTERGYAKNDAFIKRVIATPGDTIAISRGHVELNGVVLSEPFIADEPNYEWGPARVPPGYVVVLGDNRNNSFDSHIWGMLPSSNIIGRAIVRYWPPARVGSTVVDVKSLGSMQENFHPMPWTK